MIVGEVREGVEAREEGVGSGGAMDLTKLRDAKSPCERPH